MVLLMRRLPSLLQGPGEPGSPALGSTMKALRLPTRVSMVAYWFASTAHDLPPHSCSPQRSRKNRGLFQARGACSAGAPTWPAPFTWTQMGPLRSSGDPSCASAPFQDPGRADAASPLAATSMLPPLSGQRRPRRWLISGLTRSFGTRCRTLHAWRCRTRARLASGRPAEPLPQGSRTLWIATKGFSSFDDHPPFLLS
jgi:hypothetical protein